MLQLIQSLFKKHVFSLSIQKQKEKKRRVTRRLQTAVDECRPITDAYRRMQPSVDESLGEYRRVTEECRRMQTTADESLDEHRQIKTSVDESKNLCLIREKVTHVPILLLLQICNIRSHRQENVQFFSFICENTPHIVLSLPTLAKSICLLFHLMYVNSK